jgi:hypothetical protein
MKNRTNDGCDHHDKAQAAVAPHRFLLVARTLSHPPNDHAAASPTLDAIPLALGQPQAGALDNGSCSATTIAAMEARDLAPDIATGRTPHHPSWQASFAQQPAPPPADASPQVPMAYKLQTEIGRALDRLRNWTVEPVLGMIKDLLGFRQCSLRGLQAAAGAWCLGCLACNLRRLHSLTMGSVGLLLLEEAGGKVSAIVLKDHMGRNASRTRTLSDTLMWFFWVNGRRRIRHSIFSPTGC